MSSLRRVLRVCAVKNWQSNRDGKMILPRKSRPPSKERPCSSDRRDRAPHYFIQFNFIYPVSVTVGTVSRHLRERRTLTLTPEQQQWQEQLPFNRKKASAGAGSYGGGPQADGQLTKNTLNICNYVVKAYYPVDVELKPRGSV